MAVNTSTSMETLDWMVWRKRRNKSTPLWPACRYEETLGLETYERIAMT